MKYIILAVALALVGCTGHGDWDAQEAWRYYSSQPQPEYSRPVHCRPDFLGGFVCQ
jgi:hypothetical protein